MTLPAGGSSMPSGNQVKKVVKGKQYRPAAGSGNAQSTGATQAPVERPAPTLPITGKGPTSPEALPPK